MHALWRNPLTRRLGSVVPQETRRQVMQYFRSRDRARSVEDAIAGRIGSLDEIADFAAAYPVRLRAPLVIISQVHRSGGTLLSQLFDGHPELAAHPHEMKLGSPNGEHWPVLDPSAGPERSFRLLYEPHIAGLMRRGFTKGEQDPDRRSFYLMPRVQYRLFKSLHEAAPPSTPRDLADLFMTSFFNAWLNYEGSLSGKRWVTAFAPRFAHHEASATGFFETYPDGRLIQIVRDPKSWYPSAKNHGKDGIGDIAPEAIVEMWRVSANSILRNRALYGDRVIVLRFEDLVGQTEPTMRRLAAQLGIAFDPVLLQPTFNGQMMRANSSFPVGQAGVIAGPLQREANLSESERALIDRLCGPLYTSVLATMNEHADSV
jgi:hypothetical protein